MQTRLISSMNILPIGKGGSGNQETGFGSQTNRLTFRDVLNETITRAPDASLDESQPLSKVQLMEILNNIRSHMNSHLMSALSSGEKEETYFSYPRLPDPIIPPSMESSKKYQSNQNNDVFTVREDLNLIINREAEAHGLDPALIKSVIRVESNFNPNSTSPKGAMGLMQLMPGTARDLGVHNAYDPVENVRAGTRYLKTLLNRYDGNVDLALAAYNWGMGNVEKRPGKMPAETKNYIENVTRYYERARA